LNPIHQLQKTDKASENLLIELKTKTKKLLNDYRKMDEILSPVKAYGEVLETKKRSANEDEINDIKNKILEACSNFDLVTIEEEFNILKTLQLPEELNNKLPSLSKAIEEIEYDQIEELLK